MNKISNARSRNWVFEFYPESAPPDWVDVLKGLCCAIALHDKDIKEDGTPKKPHYHGVLSFSSVKSLEQVKEILAPLNGTVPFICQDVRAYTRYLIHFDDPDKYQYPRDIIQSFGGFDVAKAFLKKTADEGLTLCSEILNYLRDNDITELADLIDYAFDEGKSDWALYLTSNKGIWISQYLTSRRNKARFHLPQRKKSITITNKPNENTTTLSVVEDTENPENFFIVDDNGEVIG